MTVDIDTEISMTVESRGTSGSAGIFTFPINLLGFVLIRMKVKRML